MTFEVLSDLNDSVMGEEKQTHTVQSCCFGNQGEQDNSPPEIIASEKSPTPSLQPRQRQHCKPLRDKLPGLPLGTYRLDPFPASPSSL